MGQQCTVGGRKKHHLDHRIGSLTLIHRAHRFPSRTWPTPSMTAGRRRSRPRRGAGLIWLAVANKFNILLPEASGVRGQPVVYWALLYYGAGSQIGLPCFDHCLMSRAKKGSTSCAFGTVFAPMDAWSFFPPPRWPGPRPSFLLEWFQNYATVLLQRMMQIFSTLSKFAKIDSNCITDDMSAFADALQRVQEPDSLEFPHFFSSHSHPP